MKDMLPAAETDAILLFVDSLALVYHEARHVRFLIDGGHISAQGWEKLISLPRNRVEAWRSIQSVRQSARGEPTVAHAAELFEKRFGRNLEHLTQLYDNPHWKHAAAVGGHAWRRITACVRDIGQGLDQQDGALVVKSCEALLRVRHNNGFVRDKLYGLDRATGSVGSASWG